MRRYDPVQGKRSLRGCRRLPAGLAALALVLSGSASLTLAASDPGRPNGGFVVETGSTAAIADPKRPNGGFLVTLSNAVSDPGRPDGGFLFGNGGNGGAGAGDGAACDGGRE